LVFRRGRAKLSQLQPICLPLALTVRINICDAVSELFLIV
jgi:hypothetical protein